MTKETEQLYRTGLEQLRKDLKTKRGYGPRIAAKLKLESATEVYNVAWGHVKNAKILKALIAESKHSPSESEESMDIISSYLSGSAA